MHQQESGKERQLHEECVGEFSTSPHDVRVYLPELVKHFQLPLTAVMYLGPDNEEDIPSHLVSAVVTVCTPRTEESLIASTISEEEIEGGDIVPEDTDSIVLNDIPLNFDINVNSIPVTPLNAEKMLKQLEFVYENFNPTNVHPYLASSSSSQISLMKSVRKEGNLDGIELIEPKCLRDIRIERQKTESTSADSIAEFTKINARILAVESQHNILDTTVKHLVRQVKQRNTGDTSEMERAIGSLKMQCKDMKQKLDNLQHVVSDLSIYMEEICRNQNSAMTMSGSSGNKESSQSDINKQYLGALGVEQMSDLLIVMKLQQYLPRFQEEEISGDLLLELNEEILQKELGVENQIHRMRIMKLINGDYSAEGYLNGEGPYVQMTKN